MKNLPLLISLFIPTIVFSKTIGIGEYRYGPETSRNMACEFAEDRAKENAIKKYVGEQIQSVISESCQSEECDLRRDTYNSFEGRIKDIFDVKQKTIESKGYTSCIVTVVAEVERVVNTIQLEFSDKSFLLKNGEEITFRGSANETGQLSVFNFYDNKYHKVYTVNIAAKHEEFVIPSSNKNKIVARLSEGEYQSKELVVFLFSKKEVSLKNVYTKTEMKNLISTIPFDQRKVVNHHLSIVQ
jgi:hypothetical protein